MQLFTLALGALVASSYATTAAQNNTYRWTVGAIAVDSTTSEEADTLGLYATVTYLGGGDIAQNCVFIGDVRQGIHLTADQIAFELDFSAPATSNISIIWSLVNSANANHTYAQDINNLANDTLTLAGVTSGTICLPITEPVARR